MINVVIGKMESDWIHLHVALVQGHTDYTEPNSFNTAQHWL